MARRKAAGQNPAEKDTSSANQNGAEAPSTGHNQLSSDERFAMLCRLTAEYKKTLRARQDASAEHARTCKKAKEDYGEDAILAIKDLIALETPDGEAAMRATIERQLWMAKYRASPLGSQLRLFDEPDRMPADERAGIEGKAAGLAGEPAHCPYDPSTPQYRAWMEKYHEGQGVVLRRGIKETVATDGEPTADEAEDGIPRGSIKEGVVILDAALKETIDRLNKPINKSH